MNKEIGKYIIICVAVVCATIWNRGKGTISDLWRDVSEFRKLLDGGIRG